VRVTLLGTGTSGGVPVPTCDCAVCRSDDPRDRRLRTSALIESGGRKLLIDTSPDLRQQALRYGIERIDAILYTHAHADHILGFDELRVFNWRQGGPIPGYASPDTLRRLRRTFWYAFEEGDAEVARPALAPREIDGPFEVGGVPVVPVPVQHGSLPILGFRVGGFAYLTDVSGLPEASYALLEDLDVIVLSALRKRPHPTHWTIERATEAAVRIGARRTLLTHISHEVSHAEVDGELADGVELAHDGVRLEIPDPRGL
jgi:phosphoribosyl 1,2-cyclic phosphate phosphodiesterase